MDGVPDQCCGKCIIAAEVHSEAGISFTTPSICGGTIKLYLSSFTLYGIILTTSGFVELQIKQPPITKMQINYTSVQVHT